MDDVTQIRVGGQTVGLVGLKAALAKAAEQFNRAPVDHIGKWLREQLSRCNYIPAGSAEMYEKAFEREYRKLIGVPVDARDDEGLQIKVLGPGCPKCKKMEETARKAAEELNLDFLLEKVTEIDKIMDFGVMTTPGLVVDGLVKVTGKVPSPDEMKSILSENR
jgi:small redox-active disulfide protein 2